MPSLSIGAERCALRPGDNTIGGQAADAVRLAPLAWLAPAARISVPPVGAAVLHRLSAAIVVRVDGEPLGATPRELAHGARLDVGTLRLDFEDAPPTRGAAAAPTMVGVAVPTAPQEHARLVDPRTGRAYALVADGDVVIGRDDACDITLGGPGTSRRHARVSTRGGVIVITDESVNGTLVNGVRVQGTHALRHGDVIGLHGEELRLEVAGGTRPAVQGADATQLLAPAPSPVGSASSRDTASARGARPLATLEVTHGQLAGTSYRIERAVCGIGRGDGNDIRILDESVSTSHASLLFKAGAWYVVDLRSSNGTFVDGYRVAGERIVAAGASLRIGTVEAIFRIGPAAPKRHEATPKAMRFLQRLSRLLGSS